MGAPRFLGYFAGDEVLWGKSPNMAPPWATQAIDPFGAGGFNSNIATDGRGTWVTGGGFHSIDGFNWTRVDAHLSANKVVWNGHVFIAAGSWTDALGNPYTIATSPTGKFWTYQSTPYDDGTWLARDVDAHGDTLVAVYQDSGSGAHPQAELAHSPDGGVAWTETTAAPALFSFTDTGGDVRYCQWQCVAHTDKWRAGATGQPHVGAPSDPDFSFGQTFYESDDGIDWTLTTTVGFYSVFQIVAAPVGTQMARVIPHGSFGGSPPPSGPYYTVSDPPFAPFPVSPQLALTTDNWATATLVMPNPFDYFYSGSGGASASSPRDLDWVHDRWVLFGQTRKPGTGEYSIATSTDGITWTVDSDLLTVGSMTGFAIKYGPFGVPRLRQFPRDDALGNAPRPGRESTSVQATARQGWQGTYH